MLDIVSRKIGTDFEIFVFYLSIYKRNIENIDFRDWWNWACWRTRDIIIPIFVPRVGKKR